MSDMSRANLPILRLASYLKETMLKAHRLTSAESMSFYCGNVMLKPNETLEEIVNKYWKGALPLELNYKIDVRDRMSIKAPVRIPHHLVVSCIYCDRKGSVCSDINECSVCKMSVCASCLAGQNYSRARICKACDAKYILPY